MTSCSRAWMTILSALGFILTVVPAWPQAWAGDQILAVENALAAATSADALTPYYAPDVIVYDMAVPAEFHGWKAAHENFTKQFAKVKNFKVDILNIVAGADGKLGYAYSTQRFSFDAASGGSRMTVVFRQTDLLKNIKGNWVIAHQHMSLPYDPATGKAVLSHT